MTEILVVGRPNVGKTLFTIGFASYLNLPTIQITFRDMQGTHTLEFSISAAVNEFVSPNEHETRRLQSIDFKLPKGKGHKEVILFDSTGLIEGIHGNAVIRQAMGQTLIKLQEVRHILHIIDASQKVTSLVDRQLAHYGKTAQSYSVIANKWDLVKNSTATFETIEAQLNTSKIIPVSALHGTGYERVNKYVRRII